MIHADFSFQEGAALSNAGIVDEDVDTAVKPDELPDGRIAFTFIDNVAFDAHGIHTTGPEFIRRSLAHISLVKTNMKLQPTSG